MVDFYTIERQGEYDAYLDDRKFAHEISTIVLSENSTPKFVIVHAYNNFLTKHPEGSEIDLHWEKDSFKGGEIFKFKMVEDKEGKEKHNCKIMLMDTHAFDGNKKYKGETPVKSIELYFKVIS